MKSIVLVEFLTRHGDILTFISILNDPRSLEERDIHERNFMLDTNPVMRPYPVVSRRSRNASNVSLRSTIKVRRHRGG